MQEFEGIKVLFVAGFGPIVRDRIAGRKLYGQTLNISFKEEQGGYLHTEALQGVRSFALWPLDQAGLVGEKIYDVHISAEHVALCERPSPKVVVKPVNTASPSGQEKPTSVQTTEVAGWVLMNDSEDAGDGPRETGPAGQRSSSTCILLMAARVALGTLSWPRPPAPKAHRPGRSTTRPARRRRRLRR